MDYEQCTLADMEASILTSVDVYVDELGRTTEIQDMPSVGDLDLDYIDDYYCSACETHFEVRKPGDAIEMAKAWQAALDHLNTREAA